jgi:serine/threonine-protein kinase
VGKDLPVGEVNGTPFGRYRLIELLGRGGMREVWRAHDADTDRVVAVKLLPAHFSDNEEFQQRFRREAHAAAGLNSPHVIPIHHYGEIDGRLYVDMRLVEGRDLASVLAQGPLGPGRAVRIIEQVARALHAAHKVGLVHRDVKPSNILLDEDDYAYLIDFGIARAAGETSLTHTGGFIGSWPYMAPERFSAREADARADVYALACVLYECLTGDTPYPGDSLEQQYAGHVATPPPQPSSTNPNLPVDFDRVTEKGLAKDPDQRYATTVELANAAHNAITAPLAPPALPGDAPNPPPAHRVVQGPPPPAPAGQPEWQQPAYLYRAANPHTRPPAWAPVPQIWPADRRPPGNGKPPRQRWWRQKASVIPAALLTVTVIAAAIVITVTNSRQHQNSNSPQITPTTIQTQTAQPASAPQVTLPFAGLSNPVGVAVDTVGNVYVTDIGSNRVLKLSAGSSTTTVLPFTGLDTPPDVAVDTAGNLYVTDQSNNPYVRVVKLTAGSTMQSVLPFIGLLGVRGVAVDTVGSVYVADWGNNRVVKLAAGSSTQSVGPFTGLLRPIGVAVDPAGDLYVVDSGNNRVVKLTAGSTTQSVLPLTGLGEPGGVAVDTAGNVYVADMPTSRVLKLAAGSSTQDVMPFTGVKSPQGVAVDTAGNVYVSDGGNNRVVKLLAG